jgi:hypothetical protein
MLRLWVSSTTDDAADLARRFLPSRREPPLPDYTAADGKSLWAFQAATARYQAIREPSPSVCLRLQFDTNGAIIGNATPDSIQAAFAAGMSAVPPADWASIKAPPLGIFAEFTIKARQPWYWYLSDAPIPISRGTSWPGHRDLGQGAALSSWLRVLDDGRALRQLPARLGRGAGDARDPNGPPARGDRGCCA